MLMKKMYHFNYRRAMKINNITIVKKPRPKETKIGNPDFDELIKLVILKSHTGWKSNMYDAQIEKLNSKIKRRF